MAVYSGAVWRPIPENFTQGHIVPRLFIAHSQGGTGSLYEYWKSEAQHLESTFWIGLDGTVEQYEDSTVRADANRWANDFAISVETENHPGTTDWNADPWTPQQVASLTALGVWASSVHNIPRVLTPRWDGSGFGWHIMFGSPGPWTPVNKACPGARRIQQFQQIVMPAIRGDYTNGVPVTNADKLEIIAGVDKIVKDDFQNLYTRVNKDITNAANRVITTLGGTPTVPNK